MRISKKRISIILIAFLALFTLSACSETADGEQRKADNAAVKDILSGTSLEKTQLTERLKRQNVATKAGYVYLLNFGKPFGYYAIKGKVSNAGSQLAPEEAIIRLCDTCDLALSDGPQDDGTYGTGDPGIFFFTTEGVMVETSIDYIYTDQPMDIDAPKLG